ncbi:hypothetical protein Tdes44962_MAKER00571 [Teratosphaeria destructans]|uniref:Uncharacterized protein n=1 Tax=Teratosphaeria destructans TaxID=418781 RepID=A0A9W7SQ49_9PEZI|nr:hypothetical protein Tdes44962_MAKER00571 [Teratosphaeria destructans]
MPAPIHPDPLTLPHQRLDGLRPLDLKPQSPRQRAETLLPRLHGPLDPGPGHVRLARVPELPPPQPVQDASQRLEREAPLRRVGGAREEGQLGDGVARGVRGEAVVVQAVGGGDRGGGLGREEVALEVEADLGGLEGGGEGGGWGLLHPFEFGGVGGQGGEVFGVEVCEEGGGGGVEGWWGRGLGEVDSAGWEGWG